MNGYAICFNKYGHVQPRVLSDLTGAADTSGRVPAGRLSARGLRIHPRPPPARRPRGSSRSALTPEMNRGRSRRAPPAAAAAAAPPARPGARAPAPLPPRFPARCSRPRGGSRGAGACGSRRGGRGSRGGADAGPARAALTRCRRARPSRAAEPAAARAMAAPSRAAARPMGGGRFGPARPGGGDGGDRAQRRSRADKAGRGGRPAAGAAGAPCAALAAGRGGFEARGPTGGRGARLGPGRRRHGLGQLQQPEPGPAHLRVPAHQLVSTGRGCGGAASVCPRPRRRGGQSCPRRPQPASPGRLVRRSRRPDPPGRRRGRRITVRAEERPAVPGAGSPALRPRRSGEARVPVVIRPWHLVSSVPDCFMQEYSRQEYGILLISFSRLLWLLPVNGESPK